MDQIREQRGKIIRRVLSDVVIIGSGGIVLLLFRFAGDPYKRGFFCHDESLNHPYKDSTVTSAMLYGIGFAMAVMMISAVELTRVNLSNQSLDVKLYGKLIILLRDVYLSVAPFAFGAVIEHITTDIGKYSVGRLRPHFFSVCNIDYKTVNCSAGYIEDFKCINEDENKSREVRLSFPSGHASFSSYVAVYLMIYLQRKLTFQYPTLIGPALQMGMFSLAWYTCLSRISDYKHHPTDVLAGAVIGSVSAVLVAFCVSDLFVEKPDLKTKTLPGYNTNSPFCTEQTNDSIATNL